MNIYEKFLNKSHKINPVSDFRGLVYGSEKRYAKLPAFKLRDRTISYREFALEYKALCTELIARGFKEKRIAISGVNSYGWILAYLAASSIGVAVPIDKELSTEDILDFVDSANGAAIFADSAILADMPALEGIEKFTLSNDNDGDIVSIASLVKSGAVRYENGENEIDSMKINAEEMSVLIFTSGTTGNSKGVCLSQKNICANVNSTARMVKIAPSIHSLSVLPLHHTYETTLGHLLLLSGGACISYSDGLRRVAKNITEYQPSVLIVVPQLLEFILNRIEATLRKSLSPKLLPPEGTPLIDIIKGLPAPIRLVVKRRIRKSLGGKLRLLIVGAAPVKTEIIETFCFLKIKTYQGYGLTECAPLLAGNNDFYMNAAAVGLPIHGVEIKIENPNEEGIGEVIARGDNIMLGYYNDPDETSRTMRGDYFHTGDLGRLDKDGFLYLTGRCKNVIVAQNGKNIYPEELETRLTDENFVAEAVVLGVADSKGGTAVKAKIFPCIEKIKEYYSKVPTEEEIRKEIAAVVAKINAKLPTYKKIIITEIVWEAFEKTTTKKIKRFGKNIV